MNWRSVPSRQMFLKLGPVSMITGERAGAGYDSPSFNTEEGFEASGTLEVAPKLGVELRNLNCDTVFSA